MTGRGGRGDPGKRIDTLLTTAEWKAFRVAAKHRGFSLRFAARLAIQDWTSMEEAARRDLPPTPPRDGVEAGE